MCVSSQVILTLEYPKAQEFSGCWHHDPKRPQLAFVGYFSWGDGPYIGFLCIVISHNCSPCSDLVSFLSVPEFVVAEPTCPCQGEHFGLRPCRVQHCSIQAWGQLYAFEFLEDHALLSSSFVSSQVVNSSFSLLRRFPGNCFAGGKPLQPPGATSRVTFCAGQLVSMS